MCHPIGQLDHRMKTLEMADLGPRLAGAWRLDLQSALYDILIDLLIPVNWSHVSKKRKKTRSRLMLANKGLLKQTF